MISAIAVLERAVLLQVHTQRICAFKFERQTPESVDVHRVPLGFAMKGRESKPGTSTCFTNVAASNLSSLRKRRSCSLLSIIRLDPLDRRSAKLARDTRPGQPARLQDAQAFIVPTARVRHRVTP
jgi:hypothetical protein